jgi:CBS-domain-containing membrane protein
VCRLVAEEKNPMTYPAETCMSESVVTVRADVLFREEEATMEHHQVRRVLVVDDRGCCIGIISQAEVASVARVGQVGELVREVSRDT